jgi:hypothetical protein
MGAPTGEPARERVRIALAARAVSPDQVNPDFADELSRTYRNPGLAPLPFAGS